MEVKEASASYMRTTGYKQTEVGVIPEDWEVSSLGQLGSWKGGATPSMQNPSFWENGTIPWVSSGDVKRPLLFDAPMKITSHAVKNSSTTLLPANSIVIVTRSGILRKYLPVAKNVLPLAINQDIKALIPVANHVPDYLLHLLLWSGPQILARCMKSGTTVESVEFRWLKSFAVPLPPTKAEQGAIAEALSDADALIESLEQLLSKKRHLKQGAMQQLLTGKKRLPGFSGEWEVKRLGDVATFYKGKGLPKSALDPYGREPCIHYGELFTRYPEVIGEIISRTDTADVAFRSVANDVLMPTSDVTPRGLAKASCVRIDDVILGGDILVIRSDSKRIFGSFLSYLIRHEEEQVLQLVTGSTVFHLYGTDMKKFTFSMPTLPEQTAIATILSDMDANLAALEEKLAKARCLKQGMMQELLTGRIRLI